MIIVLTCGKWRTRIWTYQEENLATQVCLITASGVANFHDVCEELCRWHESSVSIGGYDCENYAVPKSSLLDLIRSDSKISLSAILELATADEQAMLVPFSLY